MKKLSIKIITILLAILMIVGCSNDTANNDSGEEDRRADISLATSGQGGTFYVAGSGIASLGTREIEGLNVTAEVTKGVVENARLIASGETEIGFAYGATAYNIQRGLQEFDGEPYEGLRGVVNVHDGALNIVTLERNNIETLDDLIGKTISIGPLGSGSASVSNEFLTSIGLLDQITIENLSFDDSASSLRDGHIDAYIIGGTTPVPSLIELEASHPVKLIGVEQERIDKFLEDYPYHIAYTIPTDVYTSVTEPVETVGYSVMLVADERVEDWVVHDLLEAMFSESGLEYLKTVQSSFVEMSPGINRFESIDLPIHPGAQQFYEENDLLDE